MEELEKWQLINSCETAEDLSGAILKIADCFGLIQGYAKSWPASTMSSNVDLFMAQDFYITTLTRAYGIRQQALYIKHINK